MGYLNNSHIRNMLRGRKIEKVVTLEPWCVLIFDDGNGLKLAGSIDVRSSLNYLGGDLKVKPQILAIPVEPKEIEIIETYAKLADKCGKKEKVKRGEIQVLNKN